MMKSITITDPVTMQTLLKVKRTKSGIEVIRLDNMIVDVMAVMEDNSRIKVRANNERN